ncbi:Hypothetical protein SRAE_2000035000 [Strongyloides ratti]|uniref:Uncharacterized protein n=1 Tax=Strongyloides ratti TaxID=34506 RepID=A0A090LC34_STRRB|nr:Hypothetical protein SRAE_2000035000 [Strongyloides ratti]CEF65673.1 Hypothetical protein SRAE_2000035000 [Strongyloides ratti]
MSYHDRFHDSLKNLQLELTHLCFPPPEVIIHHSKVPDVNSLSIKYDFDIERFIVEDSEKKLKKLKDEKEAMLLKKLSVQNIYKNVSQSTILNNFNDNEQTNFSNNVEKDELIHQVVTCKIPSNSLNDTQFFHENNLLIPSNTNGCHSGTTFTNEKKQVIDFSEFETPNTVFDMVALKSIDDKAELEALLSTSSDFNESMNLVNDKESEKNEEFGMEVIKPSIVIEVNNSAISKNVQQSQNLFQYPSMPSFAFSDFKTGQN